MIAKRKGASAAAAGSLFHTGMGLGKDLNLKKWNGRCRVLLKHKGMSCSCLLTRLTSICILTRSSCTIMFFWFHVSPIQGSPTHLSCCWCFCLYLPVTNRATLHCTNGVQWLSGRVLDSRPKGCGFEPHQHHCVVSLSKTH